MINSSLCNDDGLVRQNNKRPHTSRYKVLSSCQSHDGKCAPIEECLE